MNRETLVDRHYGFGGIMKRIETGLSLAGKDINSLRVWVLPAPRYHILAFLPLLAILFLLGLGVIRLLIGLLILALIASLLLLLLLLLAVLVLVLVLFLFLVLVLVLVRNQQELVSTLRTPPPLLTPIRRFAPPARR